jgi:hypothetical protein
MKCPGFACIAVLPEQPRALCSAALAGGLGYNLIAAATIAFAAATNVVSGAKRQWASAACSDVFDPFAKAAQSTAAAPRHQEDASAKKHKSPSSSSSHGVDDGGGAGSKHSKGGKDSDKNRDKKRSK